MADVFPAGATLTIDTLSDDRSWERAIARGCLSGSDRSPALDLNVSSRSGFNDGQQHTRDQQPKRLWQVPIDFDSLTHFGSAITPWEGM